jgi:hypothetical protein
MTVLHNERNGRVRDANTIEVDHVWCYYCTQRLKLLLEIFEFGAVGV